MPTWPMTTYYRGREVTAIDVMGAPALVSFFDHAPSVMAAERSLLRFPGQVHGWNITSLFLDRLFFYSPLPCCFLATCVIYPRTRFRPSAFLAKEPATFVHTFKSLSCLSAHLGRPGYYFLCLFFWLMQQHFVHAPLPSVQKRVDPAGSGVRFIRCWRVGELFDYHLCVDAGVHGTSCRQFGVTGICRGYLFRVEILLSDYCPVKSLKYIIFKKCSLFSIDHLTMSSPGRASRTSIFGNCRYISIGDQHRHPRRTWYLSKGEVSSRFFFPFSLVCRSR
jgi:hypothetical protein